MGVYRRCFTYFQPFKAATTGAILLAIVAIGFNLLKPWPFKWIIDGVLDGNQDAYRSWLDGVFSEWSPLDLIVLLSTILVLVHIAWAIANFASNFLFVKVGLKVLLRLRTELYRTLHALPLRFHDERRSADSAFRVAYDTQSIQTIYNQGFSNIFSSGILILGTLTVMALELSWELALISLGVIPVLFLAIRHFAIRIRTQSMTIQERESALLTVAQEGLSSLRLVQAFNRERFEVDQFSRHADQSLRANLRFNLTNIWSSLVVGLIIAVATAAMLLLGSVYVLEGRMELGSLWVLVSYVAMLYAPVETLSYTAWAMEGATAGATRCFEVLDCENEMPEAPDAKPLEVKGGRIELREVAFGYKSDREILRDIDLEIASGQTTALVGGTGAGKSTLLSLLPRFYDPTAGVVLFDGQDVRGVTKDSLRGAISIVLQDTLLLSSSIRENIAYGRPGASDEAIIEAATRARAHEFIEKLPDQYDSLVGERGAHLSVGQRQRIGIARAFLKNAPVLLLDEPTSALDPTTERAVMQTIDELMEGRTTILTTHRIATIHHADQIVLLRDGAIAERGTGAELLKRNGLYAELFRAASSEGRGAA